AGKVRHIGITGLPLRIFPDILAKTEPGLVETVLSFCHYALNDTTLAAQLPMYEALGVAVINASPTGMGLLTQRGAPDWHPASPAIQARCKQAADYCAARGADIVKLAVQFVVAENRICTTLIGSASADNIRRNAQWADEPIDQE